MTALTVFERELKALLREHSASIDYDFDEAHDTHGLGTSGIALYVGGFRIRHFPYEQTLTASDI